MSVIGDVVRDTDLVVKEAVVDDNATWQAREAEREKEIAAARERERLREQARDEEERLKKDALRRKMLELRTGVRADLAPDCSSKDLDVALQLMEDALLCERRETDPFWPEKRATVHRRMRWATSRLGRTLLNVAEFEGLVRASGPSPVA